MTTATTWVYGEEYGSLVFLDEEDAQAWTAELEAISRVSTYGEARALALRGLSLPGMDDEDDVEEHPDADLYDPSEYEDWPGRAATLALDAWPKDLDDIGEEMDDLGGVPYLFIDPADEATVVATLLNWADCQQPSNDPAITRARVVGLSSRSDRHSERPRSPPPDPPRQDRLTRRP